MSLNDPLANVLSHIKNADALGKSEIITKNNSKLIKKVLDLMRDNGYIGSYEEIEDSKGNLLKINLLGRINNVGVIKPRMQIKKDQYEQFEKRFLPAKDFGIIIISTSKGLLVHNDAKQLGIGGTLISFCY